MPQNKLASLLLAKDEEQALASLIVFNHESFVWLFTNKDDEQETLYPAYLSLVNKLNETHGIKGTHGYKEATKRIKAREDADKD